MGMNVNAYRSPKTRNWVDYGRNRVSYWADEHLLLLLNEIGTIPTDQSMDEAGISKEQRDNFDYSWQFADLCFTKEQWERLIRICEKIQKREIEGTPLYAEQYSNETDEEFHERWEFIIETFKVFLKHLDWENEQVLVYTSH